MGNEITKARLAALMETVRSGVKSVELMLREQSQLTVEASAADKRVTVVVNGDRVVIETRFGPGIDDLTHAEIAAAVTEAAQRAQAAMTRRIREMTDRVTRENARLPRLSEFIPGMPDVHDMLPARPEASTAPPSARNYALIGDDGAPPMDYVDVQDWDHDRAPERRSGVAESGW